MALALKAYRRMGLGDIIRDDTMREQGITFVDANNRTRAQFGVDRSGKGKSFTSETEILRRTLAKIVDDATKEKAEHRFSDSVKSVDETDDRIQITFANSTPKQKFDLFIAGDGLGSPTHSLIFPDAQNCCICSLNQYTTYSSISSQESDGTWAHWYNAPDRRCTLTRPNSAGKTNGDPVHHQHLGEAPTPQPPLPPGAERINPLSLYRCHLASLPHAFAPAWVNRMTFTCR